MTSGGNNFNYFPENQLTKFSAVLQFKHSEEVKSCFVGLLCCFVGQYRLYIKSTLLKWKWNCGMPKKKCVAPNSGVDTGQVDPRVGSGRVGSGRVGSEF